MAEFVAGPARLESSSDGADKAGKSSRKAAIRLVRQAIDSGVRHFETAPGDAAAEASLGEVRPAFTAAMFEPLSDLPDGACPREIMAAVDRSIAQSCQALERSVLDCLLLPDCAPMTAFNGWIWRRLLEHVQMGTVQRLGVSVQSPAEARQALSSHHVRHLQLPYNLLDWRWRDAGIVNQIGRRRELSVHARSVFLDGLLAGGDASAWPAIAAVDPPAVLSLLDTLAAEMDRESVADLCLAYVRGQPFIDGVVIGTETPEALDLNLRLSIRRPLTLQECWDVDRRVPRLPEQLLNPAVWPIAD